MSLIMARFTFYSFPRFTQQRPCLIHRRKRQSRERQNRYASLYSESVLPENVTVKTAPVRQSVCTWVVGVKLGGVSFGEEAHFFPV